MGNISIAHVRFANQIYHEPVATLFISAGKSKLFLGHGFAVSVLGV